MRGTRSRRSIGTPIKASWFLWSASGQKSSILTWPQREPRVNPCFYEELHTCGRCKAQHSTPGTGSSCEETYVEGSPVRLVVVDNVCNNNNVAFVGFQMF